MSRQILPRATVVRAAGLYALVTLAGAPLARAQVPAIPFGTRVRLSTPPHARIVGEVSRQSADSIVVETQVGRQIVPLASVTRIDVSAGTSHSDGAVRGAKVGAIGLGGTVAVILVAAQLLSPHDHCSGDGICVDPSNAMRYLIPASAAIGGLIGGAIGAAAGAETWTSLYLAPGRVSISSQRSSVTSIGLSLRF